VGKESFGSVVTVSVSSIADDDGASSALVQLNPNASLDWSTSPSTVAFVARENWSP
jgi:hypothetical protein